MGERLRQELRSFYEQEGQQDYQVALYDPADWVHNRIKTIVLDWALKNVDINSLVLDAGCAEGLYLRSLASCVALGVGIDLSMPKLVRGLRYATHLCNLGFAVASLECLSFRDEVFDVVMSVETIEHVPNAEGTLHELYRVLKPGKLLICSVPIERDERMAAHKRARSWREKSGHLHTFGRRDFGEVLTQAGFEIQREVVVDVLGAQMRHRLSVGRRWRALKQRIPGGGITGRVRTRRLPVRKEKAESGRIPQGVWWWSHIDCVLSRIPLLNRRASYCVFWAQKVGHPDAASVLSI